MCSKYKGDMARKLLKKVKIYKPPVVETIKRVNDIWERKANSLMEGHKVATLRVKVPHRTNKK